MLTEALVAFAIVAVVTLTSLGAFGQGTARLKAAEERLIALAEARSIMAELTSGEFPAPSVRTGVTPAGFGWRVEIHEGGDLGAAVAFKPFRVLLQVQIGTGKSPVLELESYVFSRAAEHP